jgi:hypothetical protein
MTTKGEYYTELTYRIRKKSRSSGDTYKEVILRLIDTYDLRANWDEENKLVLLRYNMIKSRMSSPLVQECRGIVINYETLEIVCHPFNKFFNYGEGNAAPINFAESVAIEKMDGSLCTVWFDSNDELQVSTIGRMYGDGGVNGSSDKTFRELFLEVAGDRLEQLDKNHCWMFELCTRQNVIVKHYEKPDIYLLGGRCMYSGRELYQAELCLIAFNQDIPRPKIYRFGNIRDIDEVIGWTRDLNEVDEGFVVVDNKSSYRVKVKNPSYVTLHHLKSDLVSTDKAMVKIVLFNEGDEFLSYLPQYKDDYFKIRKGYKRLVSEINNIYNNIKHIEERKKFAQKATKHKYASALFMLRDDRYYDVETILQNLKFDVVYKLIMEKVNNGKK